MNHEDLVKLAQAQGRADIADWITNTVAADAADRAAEAARPISTPVGDLVPGRRYNVTIGAYGYHPERRMKDVTPRRSCWGTVTLVYPGRSTRHLYGLDLQHVTAIEELP